MQVSKTIEIFFAFSFNQDLYQPWTNVTRFDFDSSLCCLENESRTFKDLILENVNLAFTPLKNDANTLVSCF